MSRLFARRAPLAWRAPAVDLVVLALLSFPAWGLLLAPGYPGTHDGLFHLFRLAELDAAIRAGVAYPRLAANLALGYDYPVFNYYPPLSLYLAELFRLAGLGYIDAVKATLALSVVAAGWSMLLFARSVLPRPGAWVAALAYIYLPYLLLDVYVRGALAEALALPLLPLCLWAFRRLASQVDASRIAVGGLCLAALLLAHNVTAVMFLPVLGACWLLTAMGAKQTRSVRGIGRAALGAIAAGALALALGAFYWLPALLERDLVASGRLIEQFFDYHEHFQPLSRLVQTSLAYDYRYDFERRALFRAGLVQVALGVLGCLAALIRGGPARREGLLWGIVLAGGLVLQSSRTAPIWEVVPLAAYVQFPWRLLAVVGVASSLLTGHLAAMLCHGPRFIWPSRAVTALLAVVLVGSALAGLPSGRLALQEAEVRPWTMQRMELDRKLVAATRGEYVPRRVTASPFDFPELPAESPGAGQVRLTVREAGPFHLELDVAAERSASVLFDRFYFPGWQARVDGRLAPTRSAGPLGLLATEVPSGEHRLSLWFGSTPLRSAAVAISTVGLLALAGLAAGSAIGRQTGTHAALRGHLRRIVGPVESRGQGDDLSAQSTFDARSRGIVAIVRAALHGWPDRDSGTARPHVPTPGTTSDDVRQASQSGGREAPAEDEPPHYRLGRQAADGGGRLAPPSHQARDETSRYGLDFPSSRSQEGPGFEPPPSRLSLSTHFLLYCAVAGAALVAALAFGASLSGMAARAGATGASRMLGEAAAGDLGPDIRLAGAALDSSADGLLALTLYWQARARPVQDYVVALRLLDPSGNVVGTRNKRPLFGLRPTSLWEAGQLVRDHQEIALRPGTTAGEYDLVVGLVDSRTASYLRPAGAPALEWRDGADVGVGLLLGRMQLPGRPASDASPLARASGARFDDRIALESYQLCRLGSDGAELPLGAGDAYVATVGQGERLRIQLRWRALHDLDEDYAVFTHLLDSRQQMLAQDDEWPHRGFYPTTLWLPGEEVSDEYEIKVPKAAPMGRYDLSVGLYRRADYRRLRLTGGQAGGDRLSLGSVKVEPRPPLRADRLSLRRRIDARLGGEVTLLGYDLRSAGSADRPTTELKARPGGRLALTLYWQASQRLSQDYTVFVHLYDAQGALRCQSDGPPAGGNYPTTLWEAREVVADEHSLELRPDLPPGRYQLAAGMYLLQSGVRLKLPSGADRVLLEELAVGE